MAKDVQSVAFSLDRSPANVNGGQGWSEKTARAWLTEQSMKAGSVQRSDTGLRFPQQTSMMFAAGTYENITEKLPTGVTKIVATRREVSVRDKMY